eukprot:TRINITY_DN6046_c0_g1_i1.p1 TRINITY_DN6046_c0_g1~~TRINITY_DN6046_c0_g1_i1.p1  ORF type:complete len:427 (-),score=67.19 TRINITY_DN6046_c0_g1_i1:27-1307(-)
MMSTEGNQQHKFITAKTGQPPIPNKLGVVGRPLRPAPLPPGFSTPTPPSLTTNEKPIDSLENKNVNLDIPLDVNNPPSGGRRSAPPTPRIESDLATLAQESKEPPKNLGESKVEEDDSGGEFSDGIEEDEANGIALWMKLLGDKYSTKVVLEVSPIVVAVIHALDNEAALNQEGIFRVNGGAAEVRFLREAFKEVHARKKDAIEVANAIDLRKIPVHTICSLLVSYLGEAEPIFSWELHDKWIETSKIENPTFRLSQLMGLIEQLPASNHIHLYLLLRFLGKIVKHSESNKMTLNNLSRIFPPLICSRKIDKNDKNSELHYFQDLQASTRVFLDLMEHFHELFIENRQQNNPPSSRSTHTASLDRKSSMFRASSYTDAASKSSSKKDKRRSRSHRELREEMMIQKKAIQLAQVGGNAIESSDIAQI